jgi:phosphate starvation-inducible membrane PsiE
MEIILELICFRKNCLEAVLEEAVLEEAVLEEEEKTSLSSQKLLIFFICFEFLTFCFEFGLLKFHF